MVRISKIWRRAWERSFALRASEWWCNLPRPQWNVHGVVLMAALFALTATVLWHCQGNAWVFCCGTVTAGQIAGAAVGVPFRRIPQSALCGSLLGLLFFAYAALT